MAPDAPAGPAASPAPTAPRAPAAAATLKRDYLSLLSKDRLVDLLLALDNDCTFAVFPDDLPGAVQTLRDAKPVTSPPAPPAPSAPVPAPALPAPAPASEAAASPEAPIASSSLYTSAPLAPGRRMKNENGEPTEMPSYEEMIAQAIAELADPEGTAPKVLFQWMDQNYPLQANFRPSASQALQRAYKRGRLDKLPSGRYILNPNWDGAPTSKRATRRPKQVKAEPVAPLFKPPPPPGNLAAASKPYPYAAVAAARAAARPVTPAADDVAMEDASPSPAGRKDSVPAVKKEEVDTAMAMELDPAPVAAAVHALFATLARQLTDLQAERRKKPR